MLVDREAVATVFVPADEPECVLLATKAESQSNREASLTHLREALHSIHQAKTVKQAVQQGQWEGWYCGEYKIIFSSYEEFPRYLIDR